MTKFAKSAKAKAAAAGEAKTTSYQGPEDHGPTAWPVLVHVEAVLHFFLRAEGGDGVPLACSKRSVIRATHWKMTLLPGADTTHTGIAPETKAATR